MSIASSGKNLLRILGAVVPRLATVGAAIGAVLVGYWVLSNKLDSDEAAVVGLAGFPAILLVVVAFTPYPRIGGILGHVKSVSIGSLGIELDAYKQLAASKAMDNAETDPEHSETLLDLKIRLEAKLTYLAKHVLGQRS